ncbi:MAG: hypothetical protein NTV86_19995 [Planctomycetota bacterium]|nr:hypothetical protein [Planctomycetota bacterium]
MISSITCSGFIVVSALPRAAYEPWAAASSIRRGSSRPHVRNTSRRWRR